MSQECLLDKEAMDAMQVDANSVVSWYILSVLSRELHDDMILSDLLHERLARKIDQQWSELTSSNKEYITRDGITGKVHVNAVPAWFKIAYNAIKDIQRGLQTM